MKTTTSASTTATTTTTGTTATCSATSEPNMTTTTSPIATETVHTPSSAGASGTTSRGTSLTFTNCKGFNNNDGVSCYANSILQYLLQHRSVRSACVASRYTALRDLANNYVDCTKVGHLSSRSIRKLLRAPFSVNRQQDAAKFLEALAMFCAFEKLPRHHQDVPAMFKLFIHKH